MYYSFKEMLTAKFRRKEGLITCVSASLANIYLFEGWVNINLKNLD